MAQWRAEICCWEIWLKIHFNNYLTEVMLDLFYILLLLKKNGDILAKNVAQITIYWKYIK